MSSNAEFYGSRSLRTISASSIRSLLPRSVSSKIKINSYIPTKSKLSNSENVPPSNRNIPDEPAGVDKRLPSKIGVSEKQVVENVAVTSADPPVKVIARIRPPNSDRREGDFTVKRVDNSVHVGDRKFDFDAVLGPNSSQEDAFQLVGASVVKSALAGYNTSIMAYGQTGSGKTYTMWGPPSAMFEGQSADSSQGIVPRIFEMLFAEIQREEENAEGKKINHQLRCSFLEVYNEKIGDLLDPTQRDLEIKDDSKNGFYVENLTEEYVSSYEDVTQFIIKGLSNRKVGATSINSKSSRSHIVFTCIIESWCKGTSSNCFGSSKTSRITLVDLAGLERNKLDDVSSQSVKEVKYVKKSISQLGHLVNILTEKVQTEKSDIIPYNSSCLTHLLRESLGGNSKLTVICAVSPDKRCIGESISTLRFGQKAKRIHNMPVVNEITEDDVNDLSDQIRQLKEELLRAKSNACYSFESNYGNQKGQSVRQSVNQLRLSLNRSLILPHIDNDVEEVHINEDDVRQLRLQLDTLQSSCEENSLATSDSRDTRFYSADGCETDIINEDYASCMEESESEEMSSDEPEKELHHQNDASMIGYECDVNKSIAADPLSSISIRASQQSSVLHDPTLSESPKIKDALRKSIIFSSNHLEAIQDNLLESSTLSPNATRQSRNQISLLRSSLQSSKIFSGPTESLAASLQRGLQIIDNHQRNSATAKTTVSFSFEHLAIEPSPTADTFNAVGKTVEEEAPSSDVPSASFICASCHQRGLGSSNKIQEEIIGEIGNSSGDQTSNDAKALAEAIKREKELDNVCKEQAAEIEKLNQLVEKYKHESEQKISCFHNVDSKGEIKLLEWTDGENHESEIIEEQCEVKEVQEELASNIRSVDTDEKEVLLAEIESLKRKLESNERPRSSLLLSRSIQLRKSGAFVKGNGEEDLEKERERWMEMESEWISLTDELRVDLDSSRRRADKVEMELRLEKKCTEELDDALKRSVLAQARMVEHYADLQEKYNELVGKHRSIMEGVAEIKAAAMKAGAKGKGSRFAKSLAKELSVLRVERERERELLRKENRSLKLQLRDTAEAVHAAGEVLVRLRDAEEAASATEEKFTSAQEENEKLKKQIEKLKKKHKMEMITMKQYLAESRLPEAALRPLFREDSDASHNDSGLHHDDDEAWRAEFGAIYQEHY